MNEILQGDALEVLKSLPDNFVQCVVTSPPYYMLRSYIPDDHPDKVLEIGMEETPQLYIAKMVEVFREVRRVLREDGTCWVNLGDSFWGGGGGNYGDGKSVKGREGAHLTNVKNHYNPPGFKPKDLMMIPARVAIALQEDGWWLRQEICWSKNNAMPESVTDRCTRSHEMVYMLAKSERYYYDAQAIAEPSVSNHPSGNGYKRDARLSYLNADGTSRGNEQQWQVTPTRNRRSVWNINTSPLNEAHFAVMPPKLVEPCILAGSSPRACEHCLAPWERVTERFQFGKAESETRYTDEKMQATRLSGSRQAYRAMGLEGPPAPITIGWEPTCKCANNTGTGKCVILDPFAGAGTTLLVASQLGRNWLGIELNQDYITLAMKRLAVVQPNMWEATA